MFIKYDGRELKVGDRIKLAGREGEIENRYCEFVGPIAPGRIREVIWVCRVGWSKDEFTVFSSLNKFPSLEIWIEAPKISKAAAEELKAFFNHLSPFYQSYGGRVEIYINRGEVLKKIDSMTE